MRAVLVAVLVHAGCDLALGLERPRDGGDGGSEPFDLCAPQPIDLIRYRPVTSGQMIDQPAARAACRQRGMDLLAVNDDDERVALDPMLGAFAMQGNFWVGASDELVEGSWRGPDTCAFQTSFGLGEGGFATDQNCAAVRGTDGLMMDGLCVGDFGGPQVIAAFVCETPRWPSRACLLAATDHSALTLHVTPASFDSARMTCAADAGQIVEIDSAGELADVTAIAGGRTIWLGARFDGNVWTSASSSGCPQILPWTGSQPIFGGGSCVFLDPVQGALVNACSAIHAFVCEAIQ